MRNEHGEDTSLLNYLTPIGRKLELPAGATLFEKGDPADALFALRDGLLEVSTVSEEGRKLSLNVLLPGAVFGEFSVFEGGVRSASVAAVDPCQVLRVERPVLLQAMRDNADLAIAMVKLAVSRTGWISEQLEAQAFQPLSVRLARRIIYLQDSLGHDQALALSQGDLAAHVGATRETVSRLVNLWERQGLLKLGRGRLTVLETARLRRLAATEVL